jgi:uncharacterized membrane protein
MKNSPSFCPLNGFGYFCHQKYKEKLDILPGYRSSTVWQKTLLFYEKRLYYFCLIFSSHFMTALLLAQFWGIVFIIMSVGMFIRPNNVRSIVKLAQDEGTLVFSGFLGVMIGVGHILLFNVWSSDWTIIITLIGWISLSKWMIRVFMPETTRKIVKGFHSKITNTRSVLIFIFVLGLYLVKKGFEL